MLEYIVLLGVLVAVTAALLCLGAAGTRETSYEDALAEQRRQKQREGGTGKTKKPKAPKKARPTRSRTNQTNGSAAAPRSASSAGQESAGSSSEEDNHEELLAAHRRQQELKRQQAEQQRQQAEEQRKQAEQQKLQAEQQKLQAEQQKQLEREKQEREAQLLEQQKQREREAQQQEEERQQKHQQQILEQHRQQEIAEQESKRNEKKKKMLRNDEAKPKQQKAPKSGAGLVNGVHLEDAVSLVASNGMTVDGPSLRINGRKSEEKASKKTAARQELSVSREDVADKLMQNGTSSGPLPVKKTKKQKSDKTVSVQTILQTVEEAQLSSDQLQQVVDSLLAAAADGGWSEARKGAEVAVTKKLEEANSTIARQQEAQSALTVKISDLRTDLNSERSKCTQLRRRLDAAAAEQQRLVERDQQVQLQHKQQMQQAAQQIQEERVRLQREYDEKIMQLENSSAESTRAAREGAVQHMQQQEQAALLRIQELQAELATANTQAQQVQFTSEQLSRAKGELESRMQGAEQEIQQLTSALEERTILVRHLQLEKEALQEKADESARSAADCKEKSNEVAALELKISGQAAELEQKKQQSDSLSGELSRLKTELESVKTKNNELREKNSSVLKAYQELEAKEKKNDSDSVALRNMEEGYRQLLIRLHPTASASASQDSRAWQEEFEKSAKEQREVEVVEMIVEKKVHDPELLANFREVEEQNKQLTEKAARLEEELSRVRSDLTEHQQSAPSPAELQQLQHQNKQLQQENKELLQHKTQLQQLQEENKKLRLEKDQLQQAQEDTQQVHKLQEENKQLQDKVIHYQSVLDNTETLLTSLQKSVEQEESRWLGIVKTNEDKIEEITKENEKLSQQVLASSSAEKLQAELQRVKQEKSDLQEQLAALSSKAAEVTSLRELLAEGVEAGKEQEQIIEQLQAELESAKGSCAAATSNGTPSADTTSDESESKQ